MPKVRSEAQRQHQAAYMRSWRKTSEAYQRTKDAELEKRRDGKPKVYFVQAESGPIKIGFAKKSIPTRLAELQVGNHEQLTILRWIPGTARVEKQIQRQFESARIRGEWFRPTEELLAFIETL